MLRAVYVDGETKTGKGAASVAVAKALSEHLNVYYDVAGDYYRRYAALVRQHLGLGEDEALPTGPSLEAAARAVYETRQAYDHDLDLGNLQRSAISRSVSVLGALPIAQQSGAEWYHLSVEHAHERGADVIVLDGRNPRNRVDDETPSLPFEVRTVLDLYMTCEPTEAARRAWRNRGVMAPTDEQLQTETQHVLERRNSDRQRADRPFVPPSASVAYDRQSMTPQTAVARSWEPHGTDPLPLAITIDNTHLDITEMLALVADLSLAAMAFDKK